MNVVVAVLLDSYLDHTESEEMEDEGIAFVENALRSHKPTLYLKKNGVFEPIRTIEFHQIETAKELIYGISPVNSDDEGESDSFNRENIEDWDIDKVGRWLHCEEMAELAGKFAEHRIDGNALSQLSIQELPCLGITTYGVQNRFHNKLEGFLVRQAVYKKREAIIWKAFQKYDKDKSGFLDKKEFVDAWIGVLPESDMFSKEKVAEVFDSLDIDGGGKLDFEEFKMAKKMFEERVLEANTPKTPSELIPKILPPAENGSKQIAFRGRNDSVRTPMLGSVELGEACSISIAGSTVME